jgi:hypothetical protein
VCRKLRCFLALIPTTGHHFSVSVIELYELAEGRIAGAWVGFDLRELLRHLGIELVVRDGHESGITVTQ